MLTYGLISNELRIMLIKAITNAEPTIMLIIPAIAQNIKLKNKEMIIIAITVKSKIPMNLPHPKFLIKAKISLNLNAAASSSLSTILHNAITFTKETNIANMIAMSNTIAPIAFTEAPTDSFTVNINPRKKRIIGKMD